MYHRVRRKMHWHYTLIAILILRYIRYTKGMSIDSTEINYRNTDFDDNLDNNIIDFDSAYNDKLNKFHPTQWHDNSKESHRYTVVNENNTDVNRQRYGEKIKLTLTTTNKPNDVKRENDTKITTESSFMPIELLSTTEDQITNDMESTIDPELTVIPLSTTVRTTTGIEITTITVPITTLNFDTSTSNSYDFETTENAQSNITVDSTTESPSINQSDVNHPASIKKEHVNTSMSVKYEFLNYTTLKPIGKLDIVTTIEPEQQTKRITTVEEVKYNTTTINVTEIAIIANKITTINITDTTTTADNKTIKENNSTISRLDQSGEIDVPIFTELDVDHEVVPEDYYDSKDVVPTKPPNVDALSLIFGLAGSVVESVAERVVPKGIFDLYKRMQKQSEALEAERLRSREENGGIGQFGRGILKTISTGLSAPFTQLMAGARDIGSLDSDRGFVGSVASGVTNVANSVVDAFKTRVQAIYPGTLWCGDGHSAQARSSDLGLFFFTDTCCRQHDACKLYIKAGETKYGLTNTGLFTRSHCSCDIKFRNCLQKTGSLVSGQIGLTYFNVLGPQCFRKAHPIVRCIRRTRITGQKCEEYELDYTKPKMWQWFDNETF